MLQQQYIIILLFYICSAYAKICENVNVRNSVADYHNKLKNCTVVVGNLEIALIENENGDDYKNISFPELKEITGYLLMYRIYGLTSLGMLFPNLTIIRGLSLFMDYALVLFDIRDLKEIGLYSLRRIARGSTRIDKCNHICNVLTIDWNQIGSQTHELHYFDKNENACEDCPAKCKGFCWNQQKCQIIKDECHIECIGCTNKNDPYKCIACNSYNDDGRCVSQCTNNKIRHALLASCIAERDCHDSTSFDTWWVFNGECIKECPLHYMQPKNQLACEYCGNNCPKVCDGKQIDSISSAEKLRGCTYINGSLLIRIDSEGTLDGLDENLGMIEEIDGYLKIYRSNALTTLEFFKNLRVIHGKELSNNRHALIVYENKNLHKLWNWKNFNMTIKNGDIAFHYNSQLCLIEIEKFARLLGINYTAYDVSPFSNGDKRACNTMELNVKVQEISSTNVTLTWDKFIDNENVSLVGYLVYYIQDHFKNITINDERDECDGNNWESAFASNNTQQLLNLNPYTPYAFYIKTYTTSVLHGGQSEIKRFTTLFDDPSELVNFQATSIASDTIILSWQPPIFPNGLLNHYEIVVYYEKDDDNFINQRDYCKDPHRLHEVIQVIEPAQPNDFYPNTTKSPCCRDNKKSSGKHLDFTCNRLDSSGLDPKFPGCKNYMYTIDESEQKNNISNFVVVVPKSHKIVKRSSFPIEGTIKETTATTYEVKELKHFSMYIFLLKACNSEKQNQCGSPVMTSQRTLKDDNADEILDLSIRVENFNVAVKWTEPKEPNSVIVSYQIEYKRTDLQHFKTITECITKEDFDSRGKQYDITNLLQGQYTLRAKAVSLAGAGRFSKFIDFQIATPLPSLAVIITVIVLFVLILSSSATYYYCYYRKKRSLDQRRLISSRNSDYAGSVYVQDDWEMDRDNLEILKEIGQGTFGMVYNGVIKSKNIPCAIKKINEQASLHEKIMFLNEATTMKLFSGAHHVVKLLGVVSMGQPPLVVMELMARGDLKTFLRQTRASSSLAITCNEMYRMAAEIADGMMYLTSKKLVHRDLAARNCMVSADHTVKVGDFGMARDIYATDYYRKDSGGLMPIRWMSPESLADGVFTSDSDAWSYGVLLWEMATLAELPYQGLANEQVLQFVIAQGTLERPQECPDLLYDIMEACWKWRPTHRPLFQDIVEKLESHIGQHFSLVSFYHNAEGEEFMMNAKERVYNNPALTHPFTKDTAVYWNTLEDDVSI